MEQKSDVTKFNENVISKFQVYNSLLSALPFEYMNQIGVQIPLFHEVCKKGFEEGKTPTEIIDLYFKKYQDKPTKKEKINMLFHFIQYIERQVVLFDAIEDAAFPILNNLHGKGTLHSAKQSAIFYEKKAELRKHLKDLKVRIVLTAHPTQFYPGSVLGIITDLDKAIQNDDLLQIKALLAQLGTTPFYKKQKPTPFDEAVSLIWYLENVYYKSIPRIYKYIKERIFDGEDFDNNIVELGFWPGGDRDGNPFVTTEITLQVAERLRQTILRNYYRDVRRLKRRLTFRGIDEILSRIEKRLYKHVTKSYKVVNFSQKILLEELYAVKDILVEKYKSLFLEELEDLITKVNVFGFYFASLDIRQDSRVHHNVFENIVKELSSHKDNPFPKDYLSLSIKKQINVLSSIKGDFPPNDFKDEMVVKTLGSIRAIKEIQYRNGEKGANRYIISNNQTVLNVMEAFAMLNLSGFSDKLPIDVVPLFETVDDLQHAPYVMRELYSNKEYREHLKERGNRQTIMCGFSDGTKDGGYLMANWGIFKAKEELTKVSREFGITVVFFDGRGGPPARGGGKTHNFYASLGPNIEDKEIQLTIQGQTISSNFGTENSSRYNLEQLVSSGVKNEMNEEVEMSESSRAIMDDLAETSYKAYMEFKSHPKFLSYLEKMSTLQYYAKTNIGSRPSKRSKSEGLNFSDLRAIPFVGGWSQLKQNVPGFFGVGTALKKYEDAGAFDMVKKFYQNSSFFRTLLENSMMSITKSFFELTRYMENDEEFGEFWRLIYDEYLLSKEMLLKLTGYSELMENYPESKASIEVRENIVLPLLTIQQYALREIQELQRSEKPNKKALEVYQKMVTRSLFGNINASRNSA